MDPYLPGEIPVMVLRYLAANHCVSAAMKLIDEMPRLKDYVPAKPAHISEMVYLKHLLRSSSNPGLKDVLWDYGNSKMLVEEILDNEDDMFSMSTSESLLSKIKTMQEQLKVSGGASSSVDLPRSSQPEVKGAPVVPEILRVDGFTNTDEYECPKCLANKLLVRPKTDSGCQTEELTAVQFGLQDEIPIIFYETLLNDDNLQQKIAQTINEHMQDPQGERNEKISKISSKAETEIDKFLVELLQDMPPPEDSNSISIPSDTGLVQSLGGSTSVADIERNLSSMFDDAGDCMIVNSNPSPGTSKQASAVDPKLTAPVTETALQESPSGVLNADLDISSSPEGVQLMEEAEVTPDSSRGGSDPPKLSDFITPSEFATTTPKRSQRFQSVKRITPTPLSSAPVNPVFNTSVLVEKKTMELGEKRTNMSVITTNIEIPGWRKLRRRPIEPKIPGDKSTTITNNVTVTNTRSNEVLKLGSNETRRNRAPVTSPSKRVSNRRASSSIKDNSLPPSAHKRKATPVKLTPEKAKNTEYNFMLFYPETNKPESATKPNESSNEHGVDSESTVKKTPLPLSSAPNRNENPADNKSGPVLALASENSQHDVTPMQPPPPVESHSTSSLKTISPNALQRLIASATKVGAGATNLTAGNFVNKRKSYSTPRKRKHVRNLSFATPPSLKAITPGSEPSRVESGTSQKRKANEELFSAELRSKKRLNWPDSVKKGTGCTAASVVERRLSDSLVMTSTTETRLDNNDQKQENRRQSNLEPSTSTSTVNSAATIPDKSSMPTILEESLSNMSMSKEEPYQMSQPTNNSVTVVNQQPPAPTLSNQLTIITIPVTLSDGTVQKTYFQLADDMQTLIPINVVCPVPEGTREPVPPNLGSRGSSAPLQQEEPKHPPLIPSESHSNLPAPPPIYHEPPPQSTPSVNSSSDLIRGPATATSKSSSNFQHPSNPVFSSGNLPPVSSTQLSPNASLVAVVSLNTSERAVAGTTLPPSRSQDIPVRTHGRRGSTIPVDPSIPKPSDNESSDIKHKSHRRSSKQSEPSTLLVTETSTSTAPRDTSHQRSRRSSRSKTNEKAQLPEKEQISKHTRRHRSDIEIPPKSYSIVTKEFHKSGYDGKEEASAEPEKDYMKGRGRGKQTVKPRKPVVTMSVNDLFGESPVKKRPSNSKLPSDVIAAQSVASQAVPLGGPRISPRKPPLKSPELGKSPAQKVLPNVHGILNEDANDRVLPPAHESEVPVVEPQSQMLQTVDQQQQQDSVVFSIVPAPLGFPEPTPIKNFAETGHLNISDITCDINGPLITPFKSIPPPGHVLNETHFTLPPTPRVMLEDNDSNSNSNSGQSLKLTFDGLYPANLLSSTPLKPGIPRTPGRGSSSSNSQSPIQTSKTTGVAKHTGQNQVYQQPQLPAIVPVQTQASRQAPVLTGPSAPTTSALDLSSPRSDADKSDGEISSTDDEDGAPPSKKLSSVVYHKPQPTIKHSSTGHHQPTKSQNRVGSSSLTSSISRHQQQQQPRPLPRPPPLQPLPHIPDSLNPNLKPAHGINFHVAGRAKLLTMSEQETLYSLISMGSTSVGNVNEDRKENPTMPQVIMESSQTMTLASQKPNEPQQPTNIIQQKPPQLNRLLKVIRNKALKKS